MDEFTRMLREEYKKESDIFIVEFESMDANNYTKWLENKIKNLSEASVESGTGCRLLGDRMGYKIKEDRGIIL